jgi:hypothetical protein
MAAHRPGTDHDRWAGGRFGRGFHAGERRADKRSGDALTRDPAGPRPPDIGCSPTDRHLGLPGDREEGR